MEKLEKIFDLINNYLSLAWELILKLLLKFTPQKIFIWRDHIVHKFHDLVHKIKDFPHYLKENAHHLTDFLALVLKVIKDFLHTVTGLPWKKPHLMIQAVISLCYQNFSSCAEKYELKKWQAVVIFAVTVTTFIVTPVYVLKDSKLIYNYFHPKPIDRNPASVAVEHAPKRPDYYRLAEHQFDIKNVYIPVYKYNRDGTSFVKMKSLNADFKVTLSNRYSREYLMQNNVEFIDRLNASFEPMLKQFPIQDEGRNVLKDKIGHEIETFLKDKGVEGTAEAVSVERLMSF